MDSNMKSQLDEIYSKIAEELDITDSLFERAVQSYLAVGTFLSEYLNEYVDIYTQGSFALGTVIRPLTDSDDYDLDLVCEVENFIGVDAKTLKNIIGEALKQRGRYKKLEEKKRCWQIIYVDSSQFHMDVIPALPKIKENIQYFGSITEDLNSFLYNDTIAITDKNEKSNTYSFIGSNPKGYIGWFNEQKKVIYNEMAMKFLLENAIYESIEEVPKYKIKTPLQQAIQILKRHRDVMFENDSSNKPISIIITTLAAHAYKNESSLFDTLKNLLAHMPDFVKIKDNKYYVENPSYPNENFADKWDDFPDRRSAFYDWISKAKEDILTITYLPDFAERLKKSLGENIVKRVFNAIGEKNKIALNENNLSISSMLGIVTSREKSSIPVRINHNYGKI